MAQRELYKNKAFSILGDSVSTLEVFNPPECAVFYDWENKCFSGVYAPEDTWWGQVIAALGGELLVNHSWAGSLVCRHPDCENQSYGCSNARTAALGTEDRQPNVILILMGFNDRSWGMQVEPGEGEGGADVFSTAYALMLEKLKRNYPQAEIWCLTLPRSGRTYDGGDLTPSGHPVREYNRVIRACGKAAGCRIVDLERTETLYETMDGYHPTAEGMKVIARAVLDVLSD